MTLDSSTRQGAVAVWFTGLPCSGKSTLARHLERRLLEMSVAVQVLDGDEVRKCLSRGLGFSRSDREEHLRRLALVARYLTAGGILTVTATISPYRAARDSARRTLGRFVEVYVKCPLEVCISRDVKGLYRRALAGEIDRFTGVSDAFEAPVCPEVVVETERESVSECVARIVGYLDESRALARSAEDSAVAAAHVEFLRRLLEQGWSREAELFLDSEEWKGSVRTP